MLRRNWLKDDFHQGLKKYAETVPSGNSPLAVKPRYLSSLVSAEGCAGEPSIEVVFEECESVAW